MHSSLHLQYMDIHNIKDRTTFWRRSAWESKLNVPCYNKHPSLPNKLITQKLFKRLFLQQSKHEVKLYSYLGELEWFMSLL